MFRKDYPDLALHADVDHARRSSRPSPRTVPSIAVRTGCRDACGRRNIDVELGVGVDHVEPGTVVLTRRSANLGGHHHVGRRRDRKSRLPACSVSTLGRGGRIPVGDDLSLAGHPNVFAIGDIALPPGDPLPQVAQPAIQGGNYVAEQIEATPGRPADRAVPLPRQGFDGHDRSKPGRGRVPQWPAVPRLHRLADVARAAPDRADGLPQPRQRLRQLGLELRHLRPRLPPPRSTRRPSDDS